MHIYICKLVHYGKCTLHYDYDTVKLIGIPHAGNHKSESMNVQNPIHYLG